MASSFAGPVCCYTNSRDTNRPSAWDHADLLAALVPYEAWLRGRGLSQAYIESELGYARRFLDWRTGDYVPRGMPPPNHRPVPVGKQDLAGLFRELRQYQAFLRSSPLKRSGIPTYMGGPTRFVHWLGGAQALTRRRTPRARSETRHATVARAPGTAGLAAEYARIAVTHQEAILRTVARMAIPGSVGRVFNAGTTAAVVAMLPDLPVGRLPGFAGQVEYRRWFEAALEPVAATILKNNPRDTRPGVHPGYKWGHATKVLCLFVRDLVLHSRYFSEDDARRIQWWLYCPIDGIVMQGLRTAGFDPGVDRIRFIDEDRFWRIQTALSAAAAAAGAPRVWFDDVWSKARD